MLSKIANFLRFFFGVFFLLGAGFNTVLTIIDYESYKKGGATAWPPFLQDFWNTTVVTNMVTFLILFIVIEVVLGLLLLGKYTMVKIGLAGAILFSAGLLFLGLGYPQDAWAPRIPNMVFAFICFLLLFGFYPYTLWETIRRKKPDTKTTVIGH